MAHAQKTVYALRAVYELTRRHGSGPIPIPVVAEAQGIPPRFLENIMLQLKAGGIVESVRGREGGYRLARPPQNVTVGQVLRAMEGDPSPVSCLGGQLQENCPMQQNCVFLSMWERAHAAMLAVYDGTSYADLLSREKTQSRKNETVPAMVDGGGRPVR